MLQETRLHRIRALLTTFNQLSAERIMQDLSVSRETVRRDVLELEAQGVLRRVHGGVIAANAEPEPPLTIRNTVRAKEKRAIARAAASLVQPGQTLFVDTGSTTALLAEELSVIPDLTIITNSLSVALKLSAADAKRTSAHHHIILLGGNLDADMQATHGDITVTEIQRYRADMALLSPVGIHHLHGATSFVHHEAAIARAMTQQATQCVIMADHNKIGLTSRVVYAAATDIDTIVTDSGARTVPGFSGLQSHYKHIVVA